jgi:hypothetical protein
MKVIHVIINLLFFLQDEENVMELDPSQFLAQGSSEDESENDDEERLENGNGPPILTSLGLTHVNSITPFSSVMVSLHLLCVYIYR